MIRRHYYLSRYTMIFKPDIPSTESLSFSLYSNQVSSSTFA